MDPKLEGALTTCGGTRAWLAWMLTACSIVATLTGAGCGFGDGSATGDKGEREVRPAQERADVFTKRMAKLLATTKRANECSTIGSINARSYERFSCPPAPKLARSMAKFRVVGYEEFGTGAVVDYRSARVDSGAILLFVAPDRNWGIARFGIVVQPSAGTDDAGSRAGYRAAVADFLKSIRNRDCATYIRVKYAAGQTRKQLCEYVRGGAAGTRKRLLANPSAQPVYEGGTNTFGFFTLETSKPRPAASTISVMRARGGDNGVYIVLDMAPSPTKAAIRKALRQARERGRLNGSMAPAPGGGTGKKAD